jgi:cob(I)alamin adenosyltransferase
LKALELKRGGYPKIMQTFNKKGDGGETSLLFGCRVAKDSLRCEAYGTLDEAASCLGIARNMVTKEKTRGVILRIQKELFIVGAELATEAKNYEKFTKKYTVVTEEMSFQIEEIINELEAETSLPESFIIPGTNSGSALLDLSRSIIRRAERRVVTLKRHKQISNDAILHYLNRLADLLYVLARYEEN